MNNNQRIRVTPEMKLLNASLVTDETPEVIRGRNDLLFDLALQGQVQDICLMVETDDPEILVDEPIDIIRLADGTLKAVRGEP
jgi:hypothetical protein